MAKQTINLGTAPTGAGGDDRRSAWVKAIANFDELYSLIATAYLKSNVLGTVSQTAGVPTGALLQKGSNSNGDFIRFADGTQVCWGVITLPKQALSSQATARATMPAAFVSSPKVLASALTSVGVSGNQSAIGEQAYNGVWWSATTTLVGADSWSYRQATTSDMQYQYFAIGRWF
ncbi:hypothetical protein [Pseudomonas sp. Irchel s3f19]|uniref:hypothetical protein n=1 Tax=Pseudomonas sp. Irchel s3f19 TaxID=2009146 RepID=UPI002114E702|nr:hypothetical protein [Pseudomonas sp. Irchel s3f19]